MSKVGIGIDYSNICKDYNTAYLDRDNKDPQTSKCMKSVVAFTNKLLTDFTENFGYKIYKLNVEMDVNIDEVASNRFLFYSLEKAITLQSYVIQKDFKAYDSLTAWENENSEGLLIQNDEDGEGIYLFMDENSKEYQWLTEKLADISLDEVPFSAR